MSVGQKSYFENFHFCPTPGELCPGSTGPAHTVEARPDPLNIGESFCIRKQLKMYLKSPRGTFGARFIKLYKNVLKSVSG